ncbi:MAG: helix-turn-helix domain-containing protein [Hydrogenovibrio sp.]
MTLNKPIKTPEASALCTHVTETLTHYFSALENEVPSDVYHMVISQVERPMVEFVLQKTEFNQTRAAEILGINRNTLRKKIQQYNITQS